MRVGRSLAGQNDGREVVVGRERVLAELGELLAAARAGSGSVVLLTGEAGIGTSTVADVLVERARTEGVPVLVGRAVADEGATGRQPSRSFMAISPERGQPSGAAGEQGQAYPVGAVGLGHQAGDVGLDRGDADVKPVGDLRVGQTRRDQVQHVLGLEKLTQGT
jgi:AAA ATPase domain